MHDRAIELLWHLYQQQLIAMCVCVSVLCFVPLGHVSVDETCTAVHVLGIAVFASFPLSFPRTVTARAPSRTNPGDPTGKDQSSQSSLRKKIRDAMVS